MQEERLLAVAVGGTMTAIGCIMQTIKIFKGGVKLPYGVVIVLGATALLWGLVGLYRHN